VIKNAALESIEFSDNASCWCALGYAKSEAWG